MQRALRLVLATSSSISRRQPFGVTLAGHRRHHVALGVDDRQRRPGLRRVLLPRVQLGVVEHRVVHPVALDRGGQRRRVASRARTSASARRSMTSTSPYFSSSGRSSSSTCRQLMQQNVQKSSSTILPRRSDSVSPPVLSHPRPRSSGARTRALTVCDCAGSVMPRRLPEVPPSGPRPVWAGALITSARPGAGRGPRPSGPCAAAPRTAGWRPSSSPASRPSARSVNASLSEQLAFLPSRRPASRTS